MLTQTRISDGQITSYTWDFRNRLTEVLIKTSGGTTVQDDKFTYDIENRRIGKNTLSGGQSWTAYIDANPYADFNSSGSLLYRYIYGTAIDSLLGRVDSSGNTMWYLTDKLGSVRENVDGNGNVLDSITYDTFGNILAETHPTSGDRFKYTSREWDSEIGQYFYRARYYSPTDARFDSEDPLGFKGRDTDLYRYVDNIPTSFRDSMGLVWALAPDDFMFIYSQNPGSGGSGGGTAVAGSVGVGIGSGYAAQGGYATKLIATEVGPTIPAGTLLFSGGALLVGGASVAVGVSPGLQNWLGKMIATEAVLKAVPRIYPVPEPGPDGQPPEKPKPVPPDEELGCYFVGVDEESGLCVYWCPAVGEFLYLGYPPCPKTV